MTDDNDVYTPAQFAEHVRGFGHRDPDAHPHAGIVRDDTVGRWLSALYNYYDPEDAERPDRLPGTADGLSTVERTRAMAATETATQAMEGGDMPTLKRLTGDQQQQADISGIKAIQTVDDILLSPAPVVVILGEMGAGKTDFAGLLGQRWDHLTDGERLVASNIKSLRETTPWEDDAGRARAGYVPDFGTLTEWVEQDGEPLENQQRSKLFIGDEFSSNASGTGADGYKTRQKMGPLVFKIRKYAGTLIYIGHDESSIHPLMWRLGVIVKKESQKKAAIYDRVKNGRLRGKQAEIEGIPPTDWRYNTKEASAWSWDSYADDGDDGPDLGAAVEQVAMWTIVEGRENPPGDEPVPFRELARWTPWSASTCQRRYDAYQSEDKHADAVQQVAEVIG